MQQVTSGTPVNLSATGIVGGRAGTLIGFYVNSKALGSTLVLGHGIAAGGTAITGTITPLSGWHELKVYCPTGVYATIAVDVMDITFFFAGG